MNIINHQDNGAKGLRIAASVCIILGWTRYNLWNSVSLESGNLVFNVFGCLYNTSNCNSFRCRTALH